MDIAYRVRADALIKAIAEVLKENKEIKMPENYDLLKTGHGKLHSPSDLDWMYTRMAAIARQIMCKGTVSLIGLTFRYSNRKNMGVRPSRCARGSKFVNMYCVKTLEQIGWVDYANKGDILTARGKEVLGEIVDKLME